MFCAFFIVTSTRDTDTEAVRDTLDTLLPDLFVQLGVDTDIPGSLFRLLEGCSSRLESLRIWSLRWTRGAYHSLVGELLDLLDGFRSSFLEACTKDLEVGTNRQHLCLFRPRFFPSTANFLPLATLGFPQLSSRSQRGPTIIDSQIERHTLLCK